MIDLGNISLLGDRVGEKVWFESFGSNGAKQVLAYHRDRGDPWEQNEPQFTLNPDTFQATVDEHWTEYGYL